MRVMILTHDYPPFGVAGVERQVEFTARDLALAGHQVTVLARRTSVAPPFPSREETLDGAVRVVRVTGANDADSSARPRQRTLELIFETCLLEDRIEVVLASHLKNHSPACVFIAHRWGVPVAVELHDFYFACERAHLERENGDLCDGPEGGHACSLHCSGTRDWSPARWALRTGAFSRALRQADAIICPSRFVAGYFDAHFDLSVPTTVIDSGIDADGLQAARLGGSGPSGELRLASIGGVVHHKGAHVVLRALQIAGLGPVSYTLFGDADPAYLERLRREAALVPDLKFRVFGRYDLDQLPLVLADIDAVVIPSLVWETYSLVAREAWALGVPVVAAARGGLSETIREGENGYLFDPDHPTELATILRKLSGSSELLAQLRRGIRDNDWVSHGERSTQIEALLADTIERGVVDASWAAQDTYVFTALRDACDAHVSRQPTILG